MYCSRQYILGDSKWLWPSMATMYENLCGNCVDEVELSFVWHFISIITHWFDSFQNCATMNCQRNINSILPTQLPHKFSYIVAILGHNHFESPNTYRLIRITSLNYLLAYHFLLVNLMFWFFCWEIKHCIGFSIILPIKNWKKSKDNFKFLRSVNFRKWCDVSCVS
jgi:hypothetical protein